jgi:thiosulfate/3-mercaptopyruvate sulfurtransferase
MSLIKSIRYSLGLALVAVTSVTFAASNFLVSTEWLEKNINDKNIRILEVGVDPGQFERGHIANASNINWHTDLVDPVKRDIASRENFQQLLRNAGVNKDSTIILYGDNNNWFAAWGAWVFDVYGVKNVKLLDGGRKKWEAEGRPLSVKQANIKPGNISVSEANPALRAYLSDVVSVAKQQNPTTKLIDIRSADEYNGKIFAPAGVQELSVRAGHVPSAVNVPWGQAVAEDGTFKSADELRKIYTAVGVDGTSPIITYCRIGERSSHTWFALKKILGYDVKNYDGSWTEYGNAVGVPVNNPSGTVWGGK